MFVIIEKISFLDYRPNFKVIGFLVVPPTPLYAWNRQRIGITLMQNDLHVQNHCRKRHQNLGSTSSNIDKYMHQI